MLDAIAEKIEAIRAIAAKDHLVVAGTAKSGTTWVQRLLNAHPEIYCPGEGKFGALLRGFTATVGAYNKILNETNREVYGDRPHYLPWDDATMRAGFQCLLALAWDRADHKDLSRVRYIGDKDTVYVDALEAWRDLLLPDARVVHVIRDGRDTAISNLHHKARKTGRPAVLSGDEFTGFLANYAERWARNLRRFRTAFEGRTERYHEVRYEDLLSAPGERVAAMLGFLGVDAAPALVDKMVAENAFRKLSGGREPGQEDPTSFYRKGQAGEWRTLLDPGARAAFDRASGGLLRELGYDPGI